LSFSLCIGTTGSYVPHQSLNQGHAAFMPDAGWAVCKLPPTLSRVRNPFPVSTSARYLSTRHQRFTCVRLLDSHLTKCCSAFSSTLTTRTLNPRSLRRFEVCSCKPTSRGPPSSSMKHRFRSNCNGCVRSARQRGTYSPILYGSDSDTLSSVIACVFCRRLRESRRPSYRSTSVSPPAEPGDSPH
jgi:hypothetical protein